MKLKCVYCGGKRGPNENAQRRGIVGSAHVAIIEWREHLKKRRDELLEELAQVKKVLKGPDPEENF